MDNFTRQRIPIIKMIKEDDLLMEFVANRLLTEIDTWLWDIPPDEAIRRLMRGYENPSFLFATLLFGVMSLKTTLEILLHTYNSIVSTSVNKDMIEKYKAWANETKEMMSMDKNILKEKICGTDVYYLNHAWISNNF